MIIPEIIEEFRAPNIEIIFNQARAIKPFRQAIHPVYVT